MASRVVLYGTGEWAENHLRAYQQCAEIEVVGIVGHRNQERLAELADAYSIPAKFLDLKAALVECAPDFLDVSCSPHFRLQAVEAAVGTSVRHLNLEKPLALSPSEARQIAALCQKHNLTLTVNHQKKYNAPWQKARQIIADGIIGEVRFFRATCQGNLLEQGTHLVDMLLFFHDFTAVEWVMGQVDDLEGLQKSGASAPDAAIAQMQFVDGVRAHLAFGNVGWNLPDTDNKWFQMGVEAYGDKGQLSIGLNQKLTVVTQAAGVVCDEPSLWDETFIAGLAAHLDAAARYGRGETSAHISDLKKSQQSFAVIMAIYASAVMGGRVELPAGFSDDLLAQLANKGSA